MLSTLVPAFLCEWVQIAFHILEYFLDMLYLAHLYLGIFKDDISDTNIIFKAYSLCF